MSSINHSCLCARCGNEFVTNRRNAVNCPACHIAISNAKRNETNKKKCQIPDRELTPDTEKLICIYTYRGDSIKRIACDLNRSENQVESILRTAQQSGRYDKHIANYEAYSKSGIPAECNINTFYINRKETYQC